MQHKPLKAAGNYFYMRYFYPGPLYFYWLLCVYCCKNFSFALNHTTERIRTCTTL